MARSTRYKRLRGLNNQLTKRIKHLERILKYLVSVDMSDDELLEELHAKRKQLATNNIILQGELNGQLVSKP